MKKNKKGFGKLFAGLAVGAGLGILFAPKKGSETRMELKKKMDELLSKAKDIDAKEVKENIEAKIYEIKEELSSIEAAKTTVGVFADIIDEAKYHKDEATINGCSEENYLFVGVEAPTWPTIDDIVAD